MTSGHRHSSNSSQSRVHFPDFQDQTGYPEEAIADHDAAHSHSTFAFPSSQPNGAPPETWRSRTKDRVSFALGSGRRGRQKSLSEAWQNIRKRRGSVTDNAKEIGEALKAPVSPALVLLCGGWFMTSIFSNMSSKSILISFRYPATLTVVQFAFVSTWCIISSMVAQHFPAIRRAIPALRHPIRRPSRELIMATLPLSAFQVGGHLLNSDAMSRIPVSLVHTIKGLSPLFTVLAYRIFFRTRYSVPTYLSLVPLTVGVILACSANVSGDLFGLINAFGSAILFVTQNIVSKKLFNEAARAEAEGYSPPPGAPIKPDKLNLLCYSSALALLFTTPIWIWSEAISLVRDAIARGALPLSERPDALDHGRLTLEFIFNGTFHFIQSIVAFVLLSMVSPVTYSVASLIKRVFVICFAIIWFGNKVTHIQSFGIALTFLGLYLYDRTNDAARTEKRAKMLQAREQPLLPLIKEASQPLLNGNGHNFYTASPVDMASRPGFGSPRKRSPLRYTTRSDDEGKDRRSNDAAAPKQNSDPGWLAPGTKQEATWGDAKPPANGVVAGV